MEPIIESSAQSEAPKKKDYTNAMLCHLLSLVGFAGIPLGNILGPLIIWVIKRDEDPFIDETGKEVINFQISMTIYTIIAGVSILVAIGLLLLPVILVANIVYTILAALKANEGQLYRYPFTIRFLK